MLVLLSSKPDRIQHLCSISLHFLNSFFSSLKKTNLRNTYYSKGKSKWSGEIIHWSTSPISVNEHACITRFQCMDQINLQFEIITSLLIWVILTFLSHDLLCNLTLFSIQKIKQNMTPWHFYDDFRIVFKTSIRKRFTKKSTGVMGVLWTFCVTIQMSKQPGT